MRLSQSKVVDKGHSQALIQDQREEIRVLATDLENRRTKKKTNQRTDLGTDCVIRWSWR